MNNNSIALCIPAYNAAHYLPVLLAAAKEQSPPFAEILVYDDASTDNTAEVARSLGAKVVSGKNNMGCSVGKNALAEVSTSRWLHFHDADDNLLPNFTREVLKWADRNNDKYKVLILNYLFVDFETKEVISESGYDGDRLRADSLKYAIDRKIVNFGVYDRRTFLNAGGFDADPAVLYNEDAAFHIRLAGHGIKFDYLQEVTCINYQYKKSMSASNAHKCAIARYHVLRKAESSFKGKYGDEHSRQFYENATILASHEDWELVKEALTAAKKLSARAAIPGGRLFRMLAGINAFGAYWIREKYIRMFKKELRTNG